MTVIITLTPDQVGKTTVTLSPAQIASVQLQAAASAPAPVSGGKHAPPAAPVLPAANGGGTTFPIGSVGLPEALWLSKMGAYYRGALAAVPGAHQLQYDILELNGQTWWKMTGAAQASMQGQINTIVNLASSTHAAQAASYDPNTYTGTALPQAYANLVAAKLAGA